MILIITNINIYLLYYLDESAGIDFFIVSLLFILFIVSVLFMAPGVVSIVELIDDESVLVLPGELGLLQEAIQKAIAAMIIVRFMIFDLIEELFYNRIVKFSAILIYIKLLSIKNENNYSIKWIARHLNKLLPEPKLLVDGTDILKNQCD